MRVKIYKIKLNLKLERITVTQERALIIYLKVQAANCPRESAKRWGVCP